MKAQGIALLLLATTVLAAGERSSHEGVLRQMIQAFESLGIALADIEDQDTAEAARPELRKGTKTFVAARRQAAELPPPDKAEKERLEKAYRPKLEEAMQKFFKEVRRVERLPGGPEVLVEIRPILSENGKNEK